MSYNKTIWSKGDTITAQKLNNMESGIESAADSSASGGATPPLVVPYTYNESSELYETETTFGEIRQAFKAGINVFFHSTDGSDEYVTNDDMGVVTKVQYSISTDSQNPAASGEISVGNMTWSANVDWDNLPQTVEELDVCTLYST